MNLLFLQFWSALVLEQKMRKEILNIACFPVIHMYGFKSTALTEALSVATYQCGASHWPRDA